MKKYRDVPMDLVDATLVALAEETGIHAILTLDARGIDLLVMGAYSHSPLRQLLRGSKTSDLLRSSKVPTLLLR